MNGKDILTLSDLEEYYGVPFFVEADDELGPFRDRGIEKIISLIYKSHANPSHLVKFDVIQSCSSEYPSNYSADLLGSLGNTGADASLDGIGNFATWQKLQLVFYIRCWRFAILATPLRNSEDRVDWNYAAGALGRKVTRRLQGVI